MRQVHTRPFFAFEYVNTFCDVNPPFTQNKNIGFIAGHSEVSRHIFPPTALGDKIDRARLIFHLFGDKIDRLRSFCPFLEAKLRKNATFVSFLGIKPEENAVRAAKNGKKVAQKQEGYQFCRRMPQKI